MQTKPFIFLTACLTAGMLTTQAEFIVTEAAVPGKNIGYGLSLAMWGERPNLATYTSSGELLFMTRTGDTWTSEVVDTNLLQPVVGAEFPDSMQTSLVFHNGVPTIAYYNEMAGALMLARKINNVWTLEQIDGGGGSAIGGYPEIRSGNDRSLAICYHDSAANSLNLAKRPPGGSFSKTTISSTGGAWCSFYSDDSILFSEGGLTYIATKNGELWDTSSTQMPGTQPTGGTSTDGTAEIYASAPKTSWSSLLESDSALNNYYHPSGEEASIGTYGVGACPDFEPDAGVAYRNIIRSALFGSSVSVRAIIKQNGQDLFIPVAAYAAGGLPIIRYVDMERTAKGNFQVAFSYAIHNSLEDKEIIQIAFHDSPDKRFSDSDGDDIDDAWEIETFGSLSDADSQTDTDNDGLVDLDEFLLGTDPRSDDTDADGATDSAEVAAATDPRLASDGPGAGDSDNMDDAWEIAYFGGIHEDDNGDYDHDGTSNLAEFLLGLVPSDGTSRFEASFNHPVVSWPGKAGLPFIVQRSTDMVTWTDVSIQTGIDGSNNYTDPSPEQGRGFYRVILDVESATAMVSIQLSAFTMGLTGGDTDADAPPVEVTLSQFTIAKHETTKRLWDQVRTWGLSNGYTDLPVGVGKAPDHPVSQVNWHEVLKWCNAYSEMKGLDPCYFVEGEIYRTGRAFPQCNWSNNGYRLPTEAEWEKAARGGVSGSRFPWGGDVITHVLANYSSSASIGYDVSQTRGFHPVFGDVYNPALPQPYTAPVGSFSPNRQGLFDMAGNVKEWCWDAYESSAYVNGAVDPRVSSSTATNRVVRGGGWDSSAYRCRCSDREFGSELYNASNLGFRVAQAP